MLPTGALAHHDSHRSWGLPFAVADGLHGADRPSERDEAARERLRAIYGYETSARGVSKLQPAELDVIVSAMADLPAALVAGLDGRQRQLRYDARPERFLRGADAAGEGAVVGVSGPGGIGIRLGPRWRAMTPAAQRATVVHEVAHDFARRLAKRRDWTANWRRAMHQDNRLATMRGRATAHVSRYAATGIDEDLAESVVAYLYAPALLRERAPHRRYLLAAMLEPAQGD